MPIMFRSLFTSNRVSSPSMLFAGVAAAGLAYLFLTAGNPPRATAEDKPSKTVAAAAEHPIPKGEPLATKDVSLDQAHAILAAAAKKAAEINTKMDIAVVDAGGNLKAFIRMDGAWIGSIAISIDKAFTARMFDIATKDLAEKAPPGGGFYGIQLSNHGRIMILPGGVPLKRGGQVVGAVGVSGGTGEQDQTVADAAVAAL
jgi:uncharacterized protein GlcG (DUF336 family)